MRNTDNLKPVRTAEEARALGRKGGIASGESRREAKVLRALLLKRLEKPYAGTGMTSCEALVDTWYRLAVEGDIRAITSIADRIEGRPPQQIEIESETNIAEALLEARRQSRKNGD